MKVWIDQDLCTGDGLCEEIAPDVFTLLDDGLAYVKEGSKVFSDPGGAEGMANNPDGQRDSVIGLSGGRRGHGRRPRRAARRGERMGRGVPRRVHLHRTGVTRRPGAVLTGTPRF